ncbi:MAG: hypothetical protein DMG72_21245 [Acidobacteria bacterium]|nr:MAG: hypothetical protein DMG72_21245 [Acidobacteriota bacterium]
MSSSLIDLLPAGSAGFWLRGGCGFCRTLPDSAELSALSSLPATGVTGLTNREIAVLIGTTEQVVKNYLRATFDKLGVWSRLELALYVASHGGTNWTAELALRRGA